MSKRASEQPLTSCQFCDPLTTAWPRRAFLKLGGAGLFGLTLTDFLAWRHAFGKTPEKEISIVVFWLSGGLCHLDSFDMKPDVPAEIRGEFSPIATAADGIQICELLPNLAKHAGKYALIRSMTHDQADHVQGQNLMLTGYRRSPVLEYPCIGSVVARERGWRNNLPPYVIVPEMPNQSYFGAGFLGNEFTPFVGGNPSEGGYKVRDMNLPLDVDWDRSRIRQDLLKIVERRFREVEKDPRFDAMDGFSEKAYAMISSAATRQAFDIASEPAKVRERYGPTLTGQGALLARRLVEAGVRFVLITKSFFNWDTHGANFKRLRTELPELDMAVGTLFEELHERGLLESTIVIVTGEFGRSPKISLATAGRDHWPKAFSLLIGGGGLKGGRVIGSTDGTGDSVKDNPVSPESLGATLYHQLGIDYRKMNQTSLGRPIRMTRDGAEPIKDLLA